MPLNLIAIVIAQVITFALVRQLFGRRSEFTLIDWGVAVAVGAVFGLLMDAVLGAYGIFAYLPHGIGSTPVMPRELPVLVLLFNALASYGVAAATVAVLSYRFLGPHRLPRFCMVLCGAGALAGVLGILLFPLGSVGVLFAWGLTIVSLGELALYVNRKAGPLLSFFGVRDWRPLARFWLFSAAVGTIYELVNSLRPFWVWLPETQLSETVIGPLMALVGYLALFHPLLVLFVLLRKGGEKSS